MIKASRNKNWCKITLLFLIIYLSGLPVAYMTTQYDITDNGRFPLRQQAAPLVWLCTGLSWFTVITFWAETIIFDSPEAPKPPVQG